MKQFSKVKVWEETVILPTYEIGAPDKKPMFLESEPYFRKAIEKATRSNPNPYDSEPYYNLGLCRLYQNRLSESYDTFYKAAWSNACQEGAFYFLACISARNGEYETALGARLPEIAENISLQLAFAGISFIRDCHTQFHNHTTCIVVVVIPNFFHKSIPFSLILIIILGLSV